MQQTNQEKIENYILDQVFSERPGNQTDWIDFMVSMEKEEVFGFTPCQDYELDNCEGLRKIMAQKLHEAYEIADLLRENSPSSSIQAEVTRTTTIAGIPIQEDVFSDERTEYRLVETEEEIACLIQWISELRCRQERAGDKTAMMADLKHLMSIDDEVVFSSGMTNEYVAQSDNPERFKQICLDILIASGLTEEKAEAALQN